MRPPLIDGRVVAAEGVVDGLLGAAHPEPDQLVLAPRPVAAVRRAVVEHCKRRMNELSFNTYRL